MPGRTPAGVSPFSMSIPSHAVEKESTDPVFSPATSGEVCSGLMATMMIEDPSISAGSATAGSPVGEAGSLAAYRLRSPVRTIVGVSVRRPVDKCRSRVASIASAASFGATVSDRWDAVGGQLCRHGDAGRLDAVILMAPSEGVLIDPESGARAPAELGTRPRGGPVPSPVTGGTPTLCHRGALA